jgi:hypothetical protein
MSLLLTALLSVVPQGPNGQEPKPAERIMTFVPLGGLSSGALGRSVQLPLGDLLTCDSRPDLIRSEGLFDLSGSAAESILRLLSGADEIEGLSTTVVGEEQLRITGAPDAVQRVEATARAVIAALSNRIRITAELHLVSPGTELPSLARDEELARVLSDATLAWKSSTTIRAGQTCALLDELRVRFIGDVDVEVAQKAAIGDPQVAACFEGAGVVVQAHALAGSQDLVLFCQFAIGSRSGPITARDSGNPDLTLLEAPELEASSGTLSGRMPPGRALVFHAAPPNRPGHVLVIRGSRDRAAAHPSVIPVSALLTPAVRTLPTMALEMCMEPGIEGEPSSSRETPRLGFESPDELAGALDDALGLSDRNVSVTVAGSCLVVSGDGAPVEQVAGAIRHWQDLWLRAGEVRCESLLAGDASPRRSVTFPALLGRPHLVISGREARIVRDYDVEIAQSSVAINPVSSTLLDGIVARVTIEPDVDGALAFAEITSSSFGPIERRSLEMKAGGNLYIAPESRARYAMHAPIESGQKIELGRSKPKGADAPGQVDSLTITLR